MKRATKKPTVTGLQKQLRQTRKALRAARQDAAHQRALVAYMMLDADEDYLCVYAPPAALRSKTWRWWETPLNA